MLNLRRGRRHVNDGYGGASDYAGLLREIAAIIVANAHDLAEMLVRPPTSEDDLAAVRDRDHRSARLEDLHSLAKGLRDVNDDLRHAAELLVVLRPEVIPDHLVAHARVLADAADQALALVSQLLGGGTESTLAEIDRLERQGDAIFRESLGWLFSGAHDDLDVIRWKDILEVSEHALNGIERVGDIIEQMLIRHG
jgi:hypothetical protein